MSSVFVAVLVAAAAFFRKMLLRAACAWRWQLMQRCCLCPDTLAPPPHPPAGRMLAWLCCYSAFVFLPSPQTVRSEWACVCQWNYTFFRYFVLMLSLCQDCSFSCSFAFVATILFEAATFCCSRLLLLLHFYTQFQFFMGVDGVADRGACVQFCSTPLALSSSSSFIPVSMVLGANICRLFQSWLSGTHWQAHMSDGKSGFGRSFRGVTRGLEGFFVW